MAMSNNQRVYIIVIVTMCHRNLLDIFWGQKNYPTGSCGLESHWLNLGGPPGLVKLG